MLSARKGLFMNRCLLDLMVRIHGSSSRAVLAMIWFALRKEIAMSNAVRQTLRSTVCHIGAIICTDA